MLSILKTAIITIIISFISGVLLDRYKNLSPKIVLNIKKIKNKDLRDSYIISVKNISNRTIHELNLNVQSKNKELDIYDINITRGLKYDVENDDSYYDISIPFLSKNDELSLKVDVDSSDKLSISLRSPEKFKQINRGKEYKNDNVVSTRKGNILKNIFFENKKNTVTTIVAIAVIFIVVFECDKMLNNIKNKTVDIPAPENTTDIQNQKSSDNSSENNKVNKDSNDVKNSTKKESTDSANQNKKSSSSNVENNNTSVNENNKDSSDKQTKDTSSDKNSKETNTEDKSSNKEQKTNNSQQNSTSENENVSK